jgi:hypothetical protein
MNVSNSCAISRIIHLKYVSRLGVLNGDKMFDYETEIKSILPPSLKYCR